MVQDEETVDCYLLLFVWLRR